MWKNQPEALSGPRSRDRRVTWGNFGTRPDGCALQGARRDDGRDQEPKWTTHRTAERMIQESGVHVRHERGDRAFYNMQTDTVIGEVHHQVKLTESADPDTHASTADA